MSGELDGWMWRCGKDWWPALAPKWSFHHRRKVDVHEEMIGGVIIVVVQQRTFTSAWCDNTLIFLIVESLQSQYFTPVVVVVCIEMDGRMKSQSFLTLFTPVWLQRLHNLWYASGESKVPGLRLIRRISALFSVSLLCSTCETSCSVTKTKMWIKSLQKEVKA